MFPTTDSVISETNEKEWSDKIISTAQKKSSLLHYMIQSKFQGPCKMNNNGKIVGFYRAAWNAVAV